MENKFSYTYSAPTEEERAEIESIRRGYMAETREKTDLERLRGLDKKVKKIPSILTLSTGIIGVLVLGVGMTMVMEWNLLVWGIVVGIIGCIMLGIAYPLYKILLKTQKKKYGQEILELSEKLLNMNKN